MVPETMFGDMNQDYEFVDGNKLPRFFWLGDTKSKNVVTKKHPKYIKIQKGFRGKGSDSTKKRQLTLEEKTRLKCFLSEIVLGKIKSKEEFNLRKGEYKVFLRNKEIQQLLPLECGFVFKRRIITMGDINHGKK